MQHHPLKTYRLESGLTQRQLAAMFDVSRTTVARWEARSRKVDKDLLPQITEKTGIPARDLRPDLAVLMEAVQ
jgi:transcriptional regulator with XRE-family HTH domain